MVNSSLRKAWPWASMVIAAVAMLAPLSGAAQQNKLAPGEYVLSGGSGVLVLKPGKSGALAFSIETVGANAHTCGLEGELRNGKATLEAMDEKDPCIVTMNAGKDGIEVKGNETGACRYYCGMRATFEGTYGQPAPACRAKSMEATRRAFKQLYDAKKFPEARARLEPLLTDCAKWLDWLETGRIRNDLAVTLHKLGDFKTCQSVLQPLAADAKSTDAKLQDDYPPTDYDSYLPIVRATRTNLRLCQPK